MPSSTTATAMSQEASGSALGCQTEQRFAQLTMWQGTGQYRDIVGGLSLLAPKRGEPLKDTQWGRGPVPAYERTDHRFQDYWQ